MSTVMMQRDLIVTLKKETCLNVGILSKLQPMSIDLTKQIFKDNALEKPTQNLFNHLSYYLVCIIDAKVSAALPWPLYDTKTERAYRNQFSTFVSDYSSKGLVYPVMSSYLVNPGCYKVIMLIFQLSQLAVQRMLLNKMKKNRQRELYDEMTEKYKQNNEQFLETIEVKTEIMSSKFSKYLHKRNEMEKIAGIFRCKITEIETKLSTLDAQKYIDKLVDNYIKNNSLDDQTKSEILNIKNVYSTSKFFDSWLKYVDNRINSCESLWTEKVLPFLEICRKARVNTESLISRHTGEADKDSYMIEYNHSRDEICTKELQDQVNVEQKYILKNIVKENKLNFPNLIRGFLISICFILKNTEIGDEIHKFNEYLEGQCHDFNEIVTAMKILNKRVLNAESRLEPSPFFIDQSALIKETTELPQFPNLSDLKANKDVHSQILFDTFTPFRFSKHQFNLHRRTFSSSITTTQPKSLLKAPFYQAPREDFLKNLIPSYVSSHDRHNVSNLHDISMISQITQRGNETIAECSSGFTKQQIMRLLSTKKSSSSKKFKYNTQRPDIHIKKGGLFNDSNVSNESSGLFRSHSSPNLFENRDKKSYSKLVKRKLSIMQEDSPSLLEVSGIAVLERDSCYSTPEAVVNNIQKSDTTSLPLILVKNDMGIKVDSILKNIEVDLNRDLEDNDIQTVLNKERKSIEAEKEISKVVTPKTDTVPVRKTSSLEKIINRYKKVKANILQDKSKEDTNEFKTIVEENYSSVNVDVFTANRVLLPDLLSPSCSVLSIKNMDYLDFEIDDKDRKRPRESLGTALGVDHTFLDQFDLID